MDEYRAALIAEARNEDFRGSLQHLRSWEQIDKLLVSLADELEESERQVFVHETLRESAT